VDSLSKLWVVVPAFNEATVIAGVVSGLRVAWPLVVVVDDCSSDRTGDEARSAGAIVLRHAINLGQGAATQTGIRFAHEHGAAFIVTFDSDGQHRVEDIDALIERQRETGADVVLGSRFLGRAEGISSFRRLVLRLAAFFTWLTTGVRLTDAHNGLRLFSREAAEKIRIRQNRMAHASEIIGLIGKLGLKVAEAPVTILYTEYSLRKGQKLSNAFNILSELFVARLSK
jgi:polyprenyl-phospho-N-acetylgalactosaminyl synthase